MDEKYTIEWPSKNSNACHEQINLSLTNIIKMRDAIRIAIDFIDQMREQGFEGRMLPAEYDHLVDAVKPLRESEFPPIDVDDTDEQG